MSSIFITYDGPSNHFGSRARQAGTLPKPRRLRRVGSLSARHIPGTFKWRKDAGSQSRKDQVLPLNVQEESEFCVKPTAVAKAASVKPRATDVVAAPTSIIHIGGIRTDPFESYPIKPRAYFSRAIDFYLTVISPYSLQDLRPLSEVLQDDLNFESMIALTLCVMPQNTTSTSKTASMWYHHSSTLATLNERLSLPSPEDCASDSSILAVGRLIVINATTGDNEHFDMHMKGLHLLIKLRGGIENLGLHVKKIVLGVSGLASVSAPPPKQPQLQLYTQKSLEYPVHPFSTDMCSVIATLPLGICELALTGLLSIQLIQRFDSGRNRLVDWLADAAPDRVQTEQWNKLIKACTELERMVWLSFVVYHIRSATYRSVLNKLARALSEYHPIHLRAVQEWQLWTRMVLLGASTQDLPSKTRHRIALGLFHDHLEAMDWNLIEQIVKKFYWNDNLASESKRYWLEARWEWSKCNDLSFMLSEGAESVVTRP